MVPGNVPGQFISHDSISGAVTSFVTDLSQATAATINSIRYAFQLQKYLERSNFGSRFFEMLNAHYGVTSPDSRLQRPEYLGGYELTRNVTCNTWSRTFSRNISTNKTF